MGTKKATINVDINAMRVVSHADLTDAGLSTNVSLVLGHTVIAELRFVNGVMTSSTVWITLPKTVVKAHNIENNIDYWNPSHMPVSLSLAHMYIWYKEGEVEYYREFRSYAETMKQYHSERAKKYNG